MCVVKFCLPQMQAVQEPVPAQPAFPEHSWTKSNSKEERPSMAITFRAVPVISTLKRNGSPFPT
jgi:hypothetical protein